MTSHEHIRIERMEIVKKMLKKMPKDNLIAQCCMQWGTSRRTILEYIKTVELANG